MEAKELRIGNYVTFMFDVNKIESIGDQTVLISNDYNQKNIINIKPIPLTEEWLLKFGFWKNIIPKLPPSFREIIEYIKGELSIRSFDFALGRFRYGGGLAIDNIKYVHQLQNLYHALTGKELEIQN